MPVNQDLPLPSNQQPDPSNNGRVVDSSKDSALSLIRSKLNNIYSNEPDAKAEETKIIKQGAHSKHQKFMQDLMKSGKSLADIQVEWHNYYASLNDTEKHQVWNEFYQNQAQTSKLAGAMQKTTDEQFDSIPKSNVRSSINKNQKIIKPLPPSENKNFTKETEPANKQPTVELPTINNPKVTSAIIAEFEQPKNDLTQTSEIKKEIVNKVSARGKLKPRHHLQSLLFGMSMGMVVLFIFMFSFFNERFITPFMTPSRTASSSPIIMDPSAQVGPEPQIIIPKINVDVPVVYDTPSIAESDIQNSLESGVVHYPTTAKPGENGNVVIVGHSSNNLLNRGKYKFAFVLLNKLETGDTITLQYNSKRYVYKVYEKIIVDPSEVGVLGPTDKKASVSLITCDPPGTSLKRLVIRAEQISPTTDSNIASNAPDVQSANVPQVVPGNAPSLFERLFGWL
jgi:sortase A